MINIIIGGINMLLKNSSIGAEVGIIQNNLKLLGYDPYGIDCEFGDSSKRISKSKWSCI